MKTVTVFGGSGFIGRYVVQNLAQAGYNIRVAVRFPNDANYLKVLGQVGQITPICAPTGIPELVDQAVLGSHAVINLTGILFEKKNQTFEHVHVDGVRNIASAAQKHGIQDVVHISAIGADKNSTSSYARTKALGEDVLRSHVPNAVILRPSVVFLVLKIISSIALQRWLAFPQHCRWWGEGTQSSNPFMWRMWRRRLWPHWVKMLLMGKLMKLEDPLKKRLRSS